MGEAKHEASALKRLARDLRELELSPVPNVTVTPSESDIFTWCGNMRGPEKSPVASLVLHFTIEFPHDYPHRPPVVKLPVGIPHPNVQKKKNQTILCLDLLSERVGNNIYEAWSLGFSALSIVMQIQAVLAGPVTIDQAWKTALEACAKTQCPHCEHAPGKVFPPFLTSKDLKERTRLASRSQGAPVVRQLKFVVEKPAAAPTRPASASTSSSTSSSSSSTSSSSSVSSSSAAAAASSASGASPASATPKAPKPKSVEDEWVHVGRKGKQVAAPVVPVTPPSRRAGAGHARGAPVAAPARAAPIASRAAPVAARPAAAPAKAAPRPAAPSRSATRDFSLLENLIRCTVCDQTLRESAFPKNRGQNPVCSACKEAAAAAARAAPRPNPALGPDKNQQRHQRRAAKRAEKKNPGETKNAEQKTEDKAGSDSKASASDTKETTAAAPVERKEATARAPTESKDDDDWNTVEKKPSAKSLLSTLPPVAAPRVQRTLATLSGNARNNVGRIQKLDLQLMVGLLQFLKMSDIAPLANTCSYMDALCRDGRLWKVLFSRDYPSVRLSVNALEDWRHNFLVEANMLATDLKCYHSKQSYEEDVLGWPLEYTVNPRTNKIDYIASTMDLLSSTSFFVDKVRTTLWNENFKEWLPLCLTHEHFMRAIPLIEKMLPRLCPHTGSTRFTPSMVLEVLPILMNTMAVLVCDKGVHASDRALEGFCLLHRLFVGLVAYYPKLQKEINTRLASFLKAEENRHKDVVDSMGNFLPLLSVTDSVTWTQMIVPMITEQAARNVIWICKEFPRFAEEKTTGQGADPVRNKKSFEASIVSQRLFMFHSYFATEVAHPGGLTLAQAAERADHFYGLPTLAQKRAFKKHVAKILAVEDWADFFPLVRLQVLPPDAVTDWLKKAVSSSLHKRYHNNKTDFTRIQASGTSTIFSRLKREGAKSGEVAFSLMWNNLDDLDLHAKCPCGTHIYYANRVCPTCNGELDVDMNAYDPNKMSEEPVENIFFKNAKPGKYKCYVVNINNRTQHKEVPFEVHVKVRDQQMKLFKKTWKQAQPEYEMVMYEFELK